MAHAINLNSSTHYVERPGSLARLRQSFADCRAYLATSRELNALGDRQLADIGLCRPAIREIARANAHVR